MTDIGLGILQMAMEVIVTSRLAPPLSGRQNCQFHFCVSANDWLVSEIVHTVDLSVNMRQPSINNVVQNNVDLSYSIYFMNPSNSHGQCMMSRKLLSLLLLEQYHLMTY